jgi:hypothetical protein
MATPREALFEAIQTTARDDKDIEGAVLIGFLVVAEWKAPDGDGVWISKISGDYSGPLPPWRQRGYASEVVNAFWEDESNEEREVE